MSRLLLVSSSRTHGTGFLDHCQGALKRRLRGIDRLLFAPYALFDRDAYTELARQRFEHLGLSLQSLHDSPRPRTELESAEALFVGGGNSFRLLRELYRHDLLTAIRARVAEGMVYIGSSAGTNLACPTIRTSNDMPITEPPSLTALGLVPFQINPHYLDHDPESTHQGETREQRLNEYLEENTTPVVGLREGCWLMVDEDQYVVEGSQGARLFSRDQEPVEVAVGSQLRWTDDTLVQCAN